MVYDCFIFYNELELLEIRLNVLNDVVDRFVLVEATRTFQGKEKPLYYEENKARFRAFQHKIIHVVVDDGQPTTISNWWRRKTPWDMEEYQRNCILRGLTDATPNDTVIVSDLDEIPDPKKVAAFQNEVGLKVFQQRNFYYYLNCLAVTEEWYGSVMAHRKDLSTPQAFRTISKEMHARGRKIMKSRLFRLFRMIAHPILSKKITLIANAGWHFGYLGNVDHIIRKIEAFSHTEYNTVEFKDKAELLRKMEAGRDLFGRDLRYEFVPIDGSFPEYVVHHRDRLRDLIHGN